MIRRQSKGFAMIGGWFLWRFRGHPAKLTSARERLSRRIAYVNDHWHAGRYGHSARRDAFSSRGILPQPDPYIGLPGHDYEDVTHFLQRVKRIPC